MLHFVSAFIIGLLGIEPRLRSPEPRVLPLYYSPIHFFLPPLFILEKRNMVFRTLKIVFGMVGHIPSRGERIDNKNDFAGIKIRAGNFCGSENPILSYFFLLVFYFT